MGDLGNWTEITHGFYRYVISAGACYEILVVYRARETNILDARANLYITGDWRDNATNARFFERELLAENVSFQECMDAAQKDYKENCT